MRLNQVKYPFALLILNIILLVPSQVNASDILSNIFPEARAYPHSEQIAMRTEASTDYLLGLGSLQKIHGDWRHKNSIRVEGSLYRFTYQITGGRGVESAVEYLHNSLPPQTLELYHCEGRGCGSSAQWASLIFRQRELYGLDSHQYYRAYRLPLDGNMYYLAAYGIKRANGRQYLHIDVTRVIDVDEGSLVTAIVESLQQGKIYPLMAGKAPTLLAANQRQAVLKAVSELDGSLAIVAHRYGDKPVEELLTLSQEWSEEIRQQLIDAGVDGSRLIAYGAGPLQPIAGHGDRLELVLP